MALVTSSAPQVSGEHSVSLVVRSTVMNLWKSLNWAWLDTICQYRRSRIGPLWETINVLVMLIGLTLVSSSIFGSSMTDIIGYVGLGIIVWTAVSSLVIEGSELCGTPGTCRIRPSASISMSGGRCSRR